MLPESVKDNLLKIFNIEQADKEKQEEFLSSLESLVTTITIDLILELLTDEEKEIFLKLNTEDQQGDKAINFAKEKIPGLEEKIGEKVKEEMTRLKDEQIK